MAIFIVFAYFVLPALILRIPGSQHISVPRYESPPGRLLPELRPGSSSAASYRARWRAAANRAGLLRLATPRLGRFVASITAVAAAVVAPALAPALHQQVAGPG